MCSPASGDAFGRARSAGTKLCRLRRAQRRDHLPRHPRRVFGCATCSRPGTLQLVARSRRGARSTWAGAGIGRFRRRSSRGARGAPLRRLAWAERTRRARAGSLRGPPAARCRGRPRWSCWPGDLRVGRPKRAAASSQPRAGPPSWARRCRRSPSRLRSDPGAARARVRAVPCHPASGRTSRSSTTACRSSAPIGSPKGAWPACATTGPARPGREPTPAGFADNLILELPGATEQPRGSGRPHRAGALAHLPLVHPRGRPGHLAPHRAHPRRRLPGRGRRGGGRGQQLPLQREPGRPAGRDHRSGRHRAGPRSGVRRVAATGRPCRRCGWPTST